MKNYSQNNDEISAKDIVIAEMREKVKSYRRLLADTKKENQSNKVLFDRSIKDKGNFRSGYY